MAEIAPPPPPIHNLTSLNSNVQFVKRLITFKKYENNSTYAWTVVHLGLDHLPLQIQKLD